MVMQFINSCHFSFLYTSNLSQFNLFLCDFTGPALSLALLVGISHPMTASSIDSVETVLYSSFLSHRFLFMFIGSLPSIFHRLKMFRSFVTENFSTAYSSPRKCLISFFGDCSVKLFFRYLLNIRLSWHLFPSPTHFLLSIAFFLVSFSVLIVIFVSPFFPRISLSLKLKTFSYIALKAYVQFSQLHSEPFCQRAVRIVWAQLFSGKKTLFLALVETNTSLIF